jgi:hypothetical protein
MNFIRRPNDNYCPGIEEYVRPSVYYDACEFCGRCLEVLSDKETDDFLDERTESL